MVKVQDKKLEDILTGKDYKDKNGRWVLVYDVELWERTGLQTAKQISPAHIDFEKGLMPDPNALYRAREHWVSTTTPFGVVTPIEECEKIKERQKEIYWEIVNEFLDWHKTEFLKGLKNAPDENGFLESELEDWRNYKFSREVVKGWRDFNKIVPRCVENPSTIKKGLNDNYYPKEEARYKFFKWLEEYQLSNEAAPPVATSTDTKEPNKELTFDALFSGDSQKALVIKAMKDLQMTDINGVSNLGERDKAKLLSFIHGLIQKKIIPKKADTKLVPLFAQKIGLECGRLRKDSNVYDDFKNEVLSYLNK